MERNTFIDTMNSRLKLVRTEYSLTQDQMARMLGMSKKTLVEIEKGRISLGWANAVTLASVFGDSQILQTTFGGELSELIIALAFKGSDTAYPRTWGGTVWWQDIREEQGYRLQQNMFSRHYRLLDPENRRRIATFHLEEAQDVLATILAQDHGGEQ